MAYEIVWTAEADNDFNNIVRYLEAEWSLLVAQKFIRHTFYRLERVASIPSLARRTSKKQTFMYKLDKKNVVFFLLEDNFLILLSFYPYKMDIKASKYY